MGGVSCQFLLLGMLLTQGLNPCLLHCLAGSLPRRHQGVHCIHPFIGLVNTLVASAAPLRLALHTFLLVTLRFSSCPTVT